MKNLIEISNAIQKFDPLIENKDFIKIREFGTAKSLDQKQNRDTQTRYR